MLYADMPPYIQAFETLFTTTQSDKSVLATGGQSPLPMKFDHDFFNRFLPR